ncbi:DUF4870 family protein [Marinomonas flavescens]|uniref:DUF4870 family protein n=1 Tax=Marinomonas flavescens TaxID=2529379 RepID=UPI00105442B0|nr:hypothetical protein [Marinomonas flavescens]
MSELQQDRTTLNTLSSFDEKAKTNALISYVLMVIGMFTGIFWLAGAIWAMVKIGDARGSIFEDHYSNIIKTFWWGLGLTLISFILMFFYIGYFILIGTFIWSIIKIVKGLARITSNKSYK